MRNVVKVRTTVCLAAAITMLVSAGTASESKAAVISPETGVAGIALSLDQYYDVTDGSDGVANALSADVKDKEDKKEAKKEEKKKESKYKNIGISIADSYVNIRKKSNTDSKILGKLYKGSAATIVERKGDWVKIKSGTVKGYIKSEFLAIGFDAEELVDKYATKYATINTKTLKVREKKTTKSICMTMVPKGETYEVLKESKDWAKISVDGDTGYVSKDYINISAEFEEAVSVAEEKAEEKRKQDALKAEADRLAALQNANNNSTSSSNTNTNNNYGNNNSSNSNSSSSHGSSNNNSSKPAQNNNSVPNVNTSATGKALGSQIAAFAVNFVGRPYVFGGTSLTNGTDCSGFTQSVYKHFGISISRTSGAQAGNGTSVSLSSLQPGDLVFYSNGGSISHVALYIGGGRVVHASTPKSGIKISSVNYRKPCKAVRIVK